MNKKNSFFFSIITPVYNREDCIGRCIDSVLKQDFCGYELIVVNDGSTDNTFNKVESYRDKIPNLNFISYTANKGVNFARNRGIEQAKGDFIIFLDSDDWLTENALNNIYYSIIKNPDYSHYLFGVSDRIDDKSQPSEIRFFNYADWLAENISGDFAHVIKPQSFINLMFIEEFRIYEALSWLRVIRKNKTQIYIPIVISERERNRKDSVTREATLDNKISMRNNYEYIINLVQMYGKDYREFNAVDSLNYQIKKGLILGIALGENTRNIILFKNIEDKKNKLMLFKLINYKIFSWIAFIFIKLESYYNQKLKALK